LVHPVSRPVHAHNAHGAGERQHTVCETGCKAWKTLK